MREFEVAFKDGSITTVHAEIWNRSADRDDAEWEFYTNSTRRAVETSPNAPEPAVFPASMIVRVWEVTEAGHVQLWPKDDDFPEEGIKV